MQDPWKFLGFPAAAVGGYMIASTQVAVFLQDSMGLTQFFSELAVVAVAGFVAGFLVDEVIPAYIEKVRNGSSAPGGDIGGDMDGDFDFE
ncbi:MAG: hypothetical protein ACI8Z7_000047 [Candidatus Nanohaloarchaea archaeon]|jgi:hypothetical protein